MDRPHLARWSMAALLAALAGGLLVFGSKYYVERFLACQVPWARLDICLVYLIQNKESVNAGALVASAVAAALAGVAVLGVLRRVGKK